MAAIEHQGTGDGLKVDFFKPGAPDQGAFRSLFYISDNAAAGQEKSP
jgi:hypothetical protein